MELSTYAVKWLHEGRTSCKGLSFLFGWILWDQTRLARLVIKNLFQPLKKVLFWADDHLVSWKCTWNANDPKKLYIVQKQFLSWHNCFYYMCIHLSNSSQLALVCGCVCLGVWVCVRVYRYNVYMCSLQRNFESLQPHFCNFTILINLNNKGYVIEISNFGNRASTYFSKLQWVYRGAVFHIYIYI